jgi:hypothetical protein
MNLTSPSSGVTGVTHGLCVVQTPPSTPPGEHWRYGLGFPMQLSPTRAGIMANIHRVSARTYDYEVGTDLLIFDDLRGLIAENAIPLSRNHRETHPRLGIPVEMVKCPLNGGFVPLGALREDGTPHPHAGTGFVLTEAYGHRVRTAEENSAETVLAGDDQHVYHEWAQLSFDGEQFLISEYERLPLDALLPGHTIVGTALSQAIPDGDDFLLPVTALNPATDAGCFGCMQPKQQATAEYVSGVSRWQRGTAGWRIVAFKPVDTDVQSTEPSLIRDVDGSLLFTSRQEGEHARNIMVWRSSDGGAAWTKIVDGPGLRQPGPVSICQAADGTPYVACNQGFSGFINCIGHLGVEGYPTFREVLCLWPLNAERTSLLSPSFARIPRYEFGPPVVGVEWYCDHPVGLTMRLADGHWHNLLCYRIMAIAEGLGCGYPPSPHSGCHMEEVLSNGPARPVWRFE